MNRKEAIKYFERVLKHYRNMEEDLEASYVNGYHNGVISAYEEIVTILKDGMDSDDNE